VAPDLAALAQAFGLRHCRVEDTDGLARALDDAQATDGGAGMIEVMIDADASRTVHQAFWRKVADTQLLLRAAK
jgi:thiamine pyrophosphate-dependent acetolactate synthase large subunit-like protein